MRPTLRPANRPTERTTMSHVQIMLEIGTFKNKAEIKKQLDQFNMEYCFFLHHQKKDDEWCFILVKADDMEKLKKDFFYLKLYFNADVWNAWRYDDEDNSIFTKLMVAKNKREKTSIRHFIEYRVRTQKPGFHEYGKFGKQSLFSEN